MVCELYLGSADLGEEGQGCSASSWGRCSSTSWVIRSDAIMKTMANKV
jgi:hypothetical protein